MVGQHGLNTPWLPTQKGPGLTLWGSQRKQSDWEAGVFSVVWGVAKRVTRPQPGWARRPPPSQGPPELSGTCARESSPAALGKRDWERRRKTPESGEHCG